MATAAISSEVCATGVVSCLNGHPLVNAKIILAQLIDNGR
jgi:hypothetical protein